MTNIACQQKGMSKNVCITRAGVMENLRRYVRTAYGNSDESYGNEEGDPILQGEGQGKPDSMGAWTLISSSILTAHENLCPGVEFISADGSRHSKRNNDQDGWSMAPNTNSVAECVANLVHSAHTCAKLIAITGGLMSYHKVNFQVLTFVAVVGFYLIQSSRNITEEVVLTDDRGQRHNIPRVPTTELNPALGFSLCPTADQRYEFKKRLQQAKECAAKAASATLTHVDAWLGLKTRVIPKVCYPFSLTRFTKRQLGLLSSTLYPVFLPKIGVNRNTSRKVVETPISMGGMGLPSMESIQDYKNISLFVRQLQWDKEGANILRILLSRLLNWNPGL